MWFTPEDDRQVCVCIMYVGGKGEREGGIYSLHRQGSTTCGQEAASVFLSPFTWSLSMKPSFSPPPPRHPQAGLYIRGDPSRLRTALSRHLVDGDNLTVVFVGGSITLGNSPDGLSFPQ